MILFYTQIGKELNQFVRTNLIRRGDKIRLYKKNNEEIIRVSVTK